MAPRAPHSGLHLCLLLSLVAATAAIPTLRFASALTAKAGMQAHAEPDDTFLKQKEKAEAWATSVEDACHQDPKFTTKTVTITVGETSKDITVRLYCGIADTDSRVVAVRTALKAFLTGFPNNFPAAVTVHIHSVDQSPHNSPVAYAYKDNAGGDLKLAVFLSELVKEHKVEFIPPNDAPKKSRGGPTLHGVRTVGDQVFEYFTLPSSVCTNEVAEGIATDTRVMHEVCHGIHQATAGQHYVDNIERANALEKAKAAAGVSQYAGKKEKGYLNEFVAEVCAGKISGMAFPEYVETLYTDAGGPAISAEMMLIDKARKVCAGNWKSPALDEPHA